MNNFTPVESSNISEVFYDMHATTEIGDLYLKFKTGGVWKYADVPKDVVTAFMDAPSKGKFFIRRILPNYEATKEVATPEEMQEAVKGMTVGIDFGQTGGDKTVIIPSGRRAGKATALKRLMNTAKEDANGHLIGPDEKPIYDSRCKVCNPPIRTGRII